MVALYYYLILKCLVTTYMSRPNFSSHEGINYNPPVGKPNLTQKKMKWVCGYKLNKTKQNYYKNISKSKHNYN